MSVDGYAITKWLCRASRAPEVPAQCDTFNLAVDTHCSACGNPRPKSILQELARLPRTPAIDLDQFLARQHVHRRELAASVDVVNGDVFLILGSSGGTVAAYKVDHNALVPCDNFGRPGW